MTLIVSYVRVLFLFFAAFIFNAHMLIPHDHHQTEFDACQLPFPESGHNHKNFPVHCHAFNNLTAEKAISYIIKHVQSTDFQDCISGIEITDQKVAGTSFSDLTTFTLKSNFTDLSSLRAPPQII